MHMTRCCFVLFAVLGLASSLPGCATREFVRGEIARSEAVLGPAVDRLAGDLQQHRAGVREVAVRATEVNRSGVEATLHAIEALGMADVAAGRATDALDHANVALTRAEEATALADRSLVEAERTAQRLSRLWRNRATPSVIEAIVLRFGVDDWTLDEQARAVALDVARRLQENPALVVQLEGYSDGMGTEPHNLRLSQLRADAVVLFLAAQGVESHRIQAIGLGTARPVADNGTQAGRRQNRRVVVRLLDPS
jgi:outer membrane protein OmpA-like peptidoglycan-associated protein